MMSPAELARALAARDEGLAPPDRLPTEGPEAPAPAGGVLEGPWDAAFWTRLEPLRSKSNFRRSRGGSSWDQLAEFEAQVTADLYRARPSTWPVLAGDRPLAERPAVAAVILARATLDTTNLSKSLCDAAEGVLYHNDASIRAEYSAAERGRTGQWALVAFAALPPAADQAACEQAVIALLAGVRPHTPWAAADPAAGGGA